MNLAAANLLKNEFFTKTYKNLTSYLTENIMLLYYRGQEVNAV